MIVQEILAAVTWQEVGGGLVALMAALTSGILVNDKRKARRLRISDESNREQEAWVMERECNRRHTDLEKLLQERQEGIEGKMDDLKCDLNKGFDRIQRTLDERR